MKNRVKGLFFTIFFLFFFSCPAYGEEITTVYIGTGEKTYKGGKLSLEKTYLSVGGAQVLKTTDYTLPPKDRTTITYLYTDHLSSTAVTANQTGKPVSFYTYYPYGEIRTSNSSNNTSPDRLYTSQRKDTLSNLYFYNARYYNPLTSRFISADKAQGPNRYSYVGNNPVMRNDPSGLVIDPGGGGGQEGITYTSIYTPSAPPLISASGVYNNTVPTGGPDDYQTAEEDAQTQFYNTMGIAAGIGLIPLAATAYPLYEVLDTGLCMLTSNASICAMSGIAPGPAVRAPNITIKAKTATLATKAIGNSKLSNAVEASRYGDFERAFNCAECVFEIYHPSFRGIDIIDPPTDGWTAGYGRFLSADLLGDVKGLASIAIHEASHEVDIGRGLFSGSFKNHYGQYVARIMQTEARAYLTEVLAGTKSVSSALRNWRLSVVNKTTNTGTLREALTTLLEEW